MREREEFVSAEPMHVNVCVGMWMERSLVNLVKCGWSVRVYFAFVKSQTQVEWRESVCYLALFSAYKYACECACDPHWLNVDELSFGNTFEHACA